MLPLRRPAIWVSICLVVWPAARMEPAKGTEMVPSRVICCSGRATGALVFWTLAALLLLFLAVNKQLDLQSFMTAAGRCMAQAQGWYENRRLVQLAFILGLAGTGVLVLLGLRRLLRGTLARTGLALLGLVLVTVFVLIRAAGFHHMDMLIGTRIAGMRLNWLLELPGPLLVLAAALRARLTPAPGCKE